MHESSHLTAILQPTGEGGEKLRKHAVHATTRAGTLRNQSHPVARNMALDRVPGRAAVDRRPGFHRLLPSPSLPNFCRSSHRRQCHKRRGHVPPGECGIHTLSGVAGEHPSALFLSAAGEKDHVLGGRLRMVVPHCWV
jgi:hypothetical protein